MPLSPYINISCSPASVSPRLSRRAATPTCWAGTDTTPQHSTAQQGLDEWVGTDTPRQRKPSTAQHGSDEQDLQDTPCCWKHAGVYAVGHINSLSQCLWEQFRWPQPCTSLEYVQVCARVLCKYVQANWGSASRMCKHNGAVPAYGPYLLCLLLEQLSISTRQVLGGVGQAAGPAQLRRGGSRGCGHACRQQQQRLERGWNCSGPMQTLHNCLHTHLQQPACPSVPWCNQQTAAACG